MRQLQDINPPGHSFIAGNVVRLSKRFPARSAAPGPYKVVAQLPERDGQLQYRVKSGCEPFYRTVAENELLTWEQDAHKEADTDEENLRF
jgi:hypothetical protein